TMKNQNKDDILIIRIIKTVKLKTLILLIVLLSFNSYAWFIYATKVSSGMNAHITSWNVKFKAGDEDITTNVVFDVDKIYPGMEDQTKTLTAYNEGEMIAQLSYDIKQIRILDTTYTASETLTSAEIEELLANYPFKLTFSIDNSNLNAENGSATFIILLTWDFESGDDALDTAWGERAYEYNKNNPNSPSIHAEIEVRATQEEKNDTT
ncbi:MAG: hypothetical protein J6A29_02855, partial [Clostridia bacterium]|nr:hypothetical protein [Clostridia bacterium]